MKQTLENTLYSFDNQLQSDRDNIVTICGVDEAGRGPLCGPVCCVAVILDYEKPIEGLNDSKKLTAAKRELLYEQIISSAIAYKIVLIDSETIDRINILNATMLGMKKAVEGLEIKNPAAKLQPLTSNLQLLVDGNKAPETVFASKTIVKGDATSAAIAAASILAKVTRDRYMIELSKRHPEYLLEKHKGYGTKQHYEILKQHGALPFYRKSFLKNLGDK